MTDEELALLTACIDDPSPDRKLVFSDWLLDHGREDEAHAYRWAAKWKRHPHMINDPRRREARWGALYGRQMWPTIRGRAAHAAPMLPRVVAIAVGPLVFKGDGTRRPHVPFQRAMLALAAALRLLLDAAS